MRILVGKCFGIGNAVMAIPMLKALQSLPGAVVDVLVGNTADDVGAIQILSKVVRSPGVLRVNHALECDYDVAIMSIPFDGRWKNGVHFRAKEVMDGRTRPDPSTTGLVSWKKHEASYQMDNARALGFVGEDPNCSFLPIIRRERKHRIYVGVGYKKDAAGFWKVKHWGNANYAELIRRLLTRFPDKTIVSTGDAMDMQLSIGPISRLVNDKRFDFRMSSNLDEAFKTVSSCDVYVGNDTGMMHVAASCGLDVIGMFFLENSNVKSPPLRVHEDQLIFAVDGSKNSLLNASGLGVNTVFEMMEGILTNG